MTSQLQHDCIQRFLFERHNIRGEIVRLRKSFHTIVQQHAYPRPLYKYLGETLVASVLLAETLKFKGQLTIQLQSSGAIQLLVAKCDHEGHIRGLAKWEPDATADELKMALGTGDLVITLQREDVIEPYQSIVALQHREISAALEYYFVQSEQLSTKIWNSVNNDHANGVLLQMLPATDDNAQQRENFWQLAARFDEWQTNNQEMQLSNEAILQRIYPDEDIRLFDSKPLMFKCTCTLPRMENAIRTLGEKDALDIIKDKQEVVVTCEFCNHSYGFNKDEVMKIFSGI